MTRLPDGRINICTDAPPGNLDRWRTMLRSVTHPEGVVRIGVVGKYAELQDAYKSIFEAIHHGGIDHRVRVEIVKLASEDVEGGRHDEGMADLGGILVPGAPPWWSRSSNG